MDDAVGILRRHILKELEKQRRILEEGHWSTHAQGQEILGRIKGLKFSLEMCKISEKEMAGLNSPDIQIEDKGYDS